MAERRYNRGGLDQGIAEYLGLKGQLQSEIEQIFRPTITLRDLSDTPYVRDAVPVAGNNTQAAVAADFSYVFARAGHGQALQIEYLEVENLSAALIQCHLRLLTQADINTIVPATTNRFVSLAQLDDEGAVGWTDRASDVVSGSDPAALGKKIAQLAIPANSVVRFTLGRPGVIIRSINSSVTARLAFTVMTQALNTAISAYFFGREWPLPG